MVTRSLLLVGPLSKALKYLKFLSYGSLLLRFGGKLGLDHRACWDTEFGCPVTFRKCVITLLGIFKILR